MKAVLEASRRQKKELGVKHKIRKEHIPNMHIEDLEKDLTAETLADYFYQSNTVNHAGQCFQTRLACANFLEASAVRQLILDPVDRNMFEDI